MSTASRNAISPAATRSASSRLRNARISSCREARSRAAQVIAAPLKDPALGLTCIPGSAADTLRGKVLGGGQPIANATVTLWSAGAGAPTQLGQARTGADGSFTLNSPDASDNDAILYLIAKGGQPKANVQAIALITVIGTKPLATVTINEMTMVASVWTHAQFIDGTAIKGPALGLRIAAGNVHNFVDLATGGFGAAISDALNSAQTPTMANFTTLADVIAGCVTRVMAPMRTSAARVRSLLVDRETSRFPYKERPHMPSSPTTPGRASTRAHAPVRIAFHLRNSVGTQDMNLYEARWLAYVLPYRRFADDLAVGNARLGADVDRYSLITSDLHRLLVAS
jgi:hypothetical protein